MVIILYTFDLNLNTFNLNLNAMYLFYILFGKC